MTESGFASIEGSRRDGCRIKSGMTGFFCRAGNSQGKKNAPLARGICHRVNDGRLPPRADDGAHSGIIRVGRGELSGDRPVMKSACR